MHDHRFIVRIAATTLLGGLLWCGLGLSGAGAAGEPSSQPPAPPGGSEPATPKASAAFPESWIGHWSGDALLDNGTGSPRPFAMEMVIAATQDPTRFVWTIIYDGHGSDGAGRQERRYHLLVRDRAAGRFAIDEENGIVIESRLLQGTLLSHFEVQGTRITTRERLEGSAGPDERIEVEMVVTREAEAVRSGGAKEDAKPGDQPGVPEVRSWMPASIQRATLRRVPVAAQTKDPAPTAPGP